MSENRPQNQSRETDVQEFIEELGAGTFIKRLALALSSAAQNQLLYGVGNKKSKIGIELSFQQMGDNEQVIVSAKLSNSLPTAKGKKSEEVTNDSVFFVGKRGVLTVNPPVIDDNNQFSLTDVSELRK